MSPEQAKGERVDGRSDLYSLGVIAYEWLAGTKPLRLDDKTLGEALFEIATRKPDRLTDFRPDLNAPLTELVMQLLEKRARRRPASASETARLLEAIR